LASETYDRDVVVAARACETPEGAVEAFPEAFGHTAPKRRS
jgi:hypothetical protein